MMKPKELSISINDYQITVYEWEGHGNPLLFIHATGFHGRIWDQVVLKLEGHHCVTVDLRGHGKSTKTNTTYEWDSFVPDINSVIDTLQLTNIIGVGHSMGGHVITKAAIHNPGTYTGLVLCDPSIFARNRYKTRTFLKQNVDQHPVARRRNEWNSVNEMLTRLRNHPNFRSWEEEVLTDYCTHGLQPTKQGKLQLSCPPEIESAMYGAYIDPDILEEITSLQTPVRLLLAKKYTTGKEFKSFNHSVSRPDIANLFPNAVSKQFCFNSHFLPMENPDTVAREITTLAAALASKTPLSSSA